VVQVHLGPPLQFQVSLTFTAATHGAEPTWKAEVRRHALVTGGRLIAVEIAQQLAPWASALGAVFAGVALLLTASQLRIQNRQHRLERGALYIDSGLSMTNSQ
jgi:hypothetical protein